MDYSLQVENISKEYKAFKLDNLSFNLPHGAIMGFIGENGAGKTTTLKLILNLIKRKSGNIKVFGLDNIKDEKIIKEKIGVVFDESYFHDTLNISDISLIMKNIYKNWDDKLYNSFTERFNLPENKNVKEFSRGMKMKLSIAAALSHKPELLILDEATSGLDPVVRNDILDVFLDFIQEENHSILISSHITEDLERIADYITFIHDGKIIFSENKDSVTEKNAILKCGTKAFDMIDKSDIISYKKNEFGYEILIKNKEKCKIKYSNYTIDNASLNDIMLFYAKGERK
ncbi:MAG: putative transporter, ATPase component [Clostridia bacterium]|nr:putative transporter, ATPase component [Clostridia bacterium]